MSYDKLLWLQGARGVEGKQGEAINPINQHCFHAINIGYRSRPVRESPREATVCYFAASCRGSSPGSQVSAPRRSAVDSRGQGRKVVKRLKTIAGIKTAGPGYTRDGHREEGHLGARRWAGVEGKGEALSINLLSTNQHRISKSAD